MEHETLAADYEQIATFIDALINQKYPDTPAAEHQAARDAAIRELSGEINNAVIEAIGDEHAAALEQLLGSPASDEAAYQAFFDNAGVDLRNITERVMVEYGKNFLANGGSNE